MKRKFADNPIFVKHEELLKKLHELIADGRGDAAEADAIREEMDHTFRNLSPEERERLEGLSADLYTLVDAVHPAATDHRADSQHYEQLAAAHGRGDWQTILRLFRQGHTKLHSDQLAYMRGRAYEHLGHLHTATLFFRKSHELQPHKVVYKIVLLHALDRLGDTEAAWSMAREEINSFVPTQDHRTVIFAAGFVGQYATGAEQGQMSGRLISILRTAIQHEQQSPESLPSVIACGYAMLATCFCALGQVKDAVDVWSEALQVEGDPTPWVSFLGRGLLYLQQGKQDRAMADFQAAVTHGAEVALPYLRLAGEKIGSGDYRGAIVMADQAVQRADTLSLQARCWEAKAIAMAELGVSAKSVRRCFQRALELDPFSGRLQHNLDVFERSLDERGQHAHWDETNWRDTSGEVQLQNTYRESLLHAIT